MRKRQHSYRYFENKACQFFPCHPELWENEKVHNCLFCFCPLYMLEDCGGTPTIAPNGLRDCSNCICNHDENSYDFVLKRFYTNGEKFT